MRRKRKTPSNPRILKKLASSFGLVTSLKAILVVLILALSVLVYQIIQRELNGLQVITIANTRNIDVHILRKDKAVESNLGGDIKVFIKQTLAKQKQLSMSTLSRLIQREFAAQQISLVCINSDEIHVRLQPRRAVFALGEAGYLRLGDQAEVFKDLRHSSESLINLHGLMPTDQQKVRYDDEGRAVLDPTRQQAARAAIELLASMQAEGFDYTQFNYIPFRGFVLSGSQKYPQALIGDKNFAQRFARLKTLTSKSASGSQVATKIELDYDDKAFIQEKAL